MGAEGHLQENTSTERRSILSRWAAVLPAEGELPADGGVGVLLADGPDGGGRSEHGGGAVFRHDTEEGPGVRRPHWLALGEREKKKREMENK